MFQLFTSYQPTCRKHKVTVQLNTTLLKLLRKNNIGLLFAHIFKIIFPGFYLNGKLLYLLEQHLRQKISQLVSYLLFSYYHPGISYKKYSMFFFVIFVVLWGDIKYSFNFYEHNFLLVVCDPTHLYCKLISIRSTCVAEQTITISNDLWL